MSNRYDLFDLELAQAEAALSESNEQKKAIAVSRRKNKTVTRKANSEKHLEELLPTIEMGNSYHIISRGDIDSMSYLVHALKIIGPIDELTVSTWCMAMPDVEEIDIAIDSGMIGFAHFCVGEIFPNQYPDEYDRLRQIESAGKVRVTVARNHSKIIIGSSKNTGVWFAIESSANMNTNPRIEQTAIHMDKDLHDFYKEFFDGLKDIDEKSRKQKC